MIRVDKQIGITNREGVVAYIRTRHRNTGSIGACIKACRLGIANGDGIASEQARTHGSILRLHCTVVGLAGGGGREPGLGLGYQHFTVHIYGICKASAGIDCQVTHL